MYCDDCDNNSCYNKGSKNAESQKIRTWKNFTASKKIRTNAEIKQNRSRNKATAGIEHNEQCERLIAYSFKAKITFQVFLHNHGWWESTVYWVVEILNVNIMCNCHWPVVCSVAKLHSLFLFSYTYAFLTFFHIRGWY